MRGDEMEIDGGFTDFTADLGNNLPIQHVQRSIGVRFTGSTRHHEPLSNYVSKLAVTLGDSKASCDAAKIYAELQTWIENVRQNEANHTSNVHELEIEQDMETASDLRFTAHYCLQQLLQLLPNLRRIWISSECCSRHFLALSNPQSLNLSKLSLVLIPQPNQLVRLATLAPNLDTLCLKPHGGYMDASWLQPLSSMPGLRYLELNMRKTTQKTLPEMHQLNFLRHLKLSELRITTLHHLCSLQQLESVILCDATIECPEAARQLAMLNVSSLTLHNVTPGHRWNQQDTIQPLQAGPCWPKLARVNLGYMMSERLLQALLLPNPVARGLQVVTAESFAEASDGYFSGREPLGRFDGRFTYKADTTPLLGPAFVAAARTSSVKLLDDFVVDAIEAMSKAKAPIEDLQAMWDSGWLGDDCVAMQKLAMSFRLQLSEDGWYSLFLQCPSLKTLELWKQPELLDISGMRAAAGRLGISIANDDQPYKYRLVRQ